MRGRLGTSGAAGLNRAPRSRPSCDWRRREYSPSSDEYDRGFACPSTSDCTLASVSSDGFSATNVLDQASGGPSARRLPPATFRRDMMSMSQTPSANSARIGSTCRPPKASESRDIDVADVVAELTGAKWPWRGPAIAHPSGQSDDCPCPKGGRKGRGDPQAKVVWFL
jgi:hypothetical protein